MTHEDTGHYSAKHPEGTVSDPGIAAALAERGKEGRVTCTTAHDLAETFKIAAVEVGKTIDLLEYRIVECQLGLFGYSPEKRIVVPAKDISQDLRDQLERLAADGRISCASCWKIADMLGIERMAVSSACELLGIKIRHCQLGAF